MHGHHDVLGYLPQGNQNNPRRVWAVMTWPYVEQGALGGSKQKTAKPEPCPPAAAWLSVQSWPGVQAGGADFPRPALDSRLTVRYAMA